MFGLACGHFFCKGCWKGYLNLKINEEGQKANLVHCMAFKCSVIVDEGVVQQIVDHDVYNKYLRCVPYFGVLWPPHSFAHSAFCSNPTSTITPT